MSTLPTPPPPRRRMAVVVPPSESQIGLAIEGERGGAENAAREQGVAANGPSRPPRYARPPPNVSPGWNRQQQQQQQEQQRLPLSTRQNTTEKIASVPVIRSHSPAMKVSFCQPPSNSPYVHSEASIRYPKFKPSQDDSSGMLASYSPNANTKSFGEGLQHGAGHSAPVVEVSEMTQANVHHLAHNKFMHVLSTAYRPGLGMPLPNSKKHEPTLSSGVQMQSDNLAARRGIRLDLPPGYDGGTRMDDNGHTWKNRANQPYEEEAFGRLTPPTPTFQFDLSPNVTPNIDPTSGPIETSRRHLGLEGTARKDLRGYASGSRSRSASTSTITSADSLASGNSRTSGSTSGWGDDDTTKSGKIFRSRKQDSIVARDPTDYIENLLHRIGLNEVHFSADWDAIDGQREQRQNMTNTNIHIPSASPHEGGRAAAAAAAAARPSRWEKPKIRRQASALDAALPTEPTVSDISLEKFSADELVAIGANLQLSSEVGTERRPATPGLRSERSAGAFVDSSTPTSTIPHWPDKLTVAHLCYCTAATTGDPMACYLAALGCIYGWGGRVDLLQGVQYMVFALEGACREGTTPQCSPFARSEALLQISMTLYELGQLFHQGWGLTHDPARAISYFRIAAELGDADSCNSLAMIYLKGAKGKKHSKIKGRDGTKRSVDVKRDKKKAAGWFREAERRGVDLGVDMSWIWKDKYNVADIYGRHEIGSEEA